MAVVASSVQYLITFMARGACVVRMFGGRFGFGGQAGA